MLSQVLDDTSGTGLDVILKKILLETNVKFENLFFFSEEIQSFENETQAFKRLLEYGKNKVIVLDKSLQLTEDVVVPSNISIVGAHQDISIDLDETKTVNHLIFKSMNNTKFSNLTLNIPLAYEIGVNTGGFLSWTDCLFENVIFNCENSLSFNIYGSNVIFKDCVFKSSNGFLKYTNFNNFNKSNLLKNCQFQNFNNITLNEKNNRIENLYIVNSSNIEILATENCDYKNIYIENCKGRIKLTDCLNDSIKILAKNCSYLNEASLEERFSLFLLTDCEGNNLNLSYDNSEVHNNKYQYGFFLNKKNTSNKMILNNLTFADAQDTIGTVLADYWTSSDIQDSVPLGLDLSEVNSEKQIIKDLGNGYFSIQTDNEEIDIVVPINNFIIRDTDMMKQTYPLYLKIFNNNSKNGIIRINYAESGSPQAPSHSIFEETKNNGISLTATPYVTLKISGSFNNTTICLKSILAETNYKIDIPLKQVYEVTS